MYRTIFIVALFVVGGPFASWAGEPDSTGGSKRDDSESQQNEDPVTSGWITGNRQSTSIATRATCSSKIVWTSPGGGPDNVLPVIGPRLSLVGHCETTSAVAVSPDGKVLASSAGSDQVVRLWSLEDGRLFSVYLAHAASIDALAFSPDGTLLASGSLDDSIKLWEVQHLGRADASGNDDVVAE